MIYKITNKINGKVYIGQTVQSLKTRWRKHCNKKKGCFALQNAIQKYGKEAFTVEQIDVACSRDELDAKEIYWIKFYDSMNPKKGYNLTSGGKHCVISDNVKQRLSETNKGKKPSDECISKSVLVRKGKKLSKDHIEKLRLNRIGERNGMFGVRRYSANNPNAKGVYCVELNKLFPTISDACKFIKRDRSAMHLCLSGKSKTCGGYHWGYVDGEKDE